MREFEIGIGIGIEIEIEMQMGITEVEGLQVSERWDFHPQPRAVNRLSQRDGWGMPVQYSTVQYSAVRYGTVEAG